MFSRIWKIKRTIFKFSIVGISGLLVNQGMLAFLVSYLGISLEISGVIAIETSILNNFFLNNYWTWSHKKQDPFLNRLTKYHAVTAVSAVINYATLIMLTKLGMNYLLANFIGVGLGVIINFFFNHRWTFKNQVEEDENKN